MINNFFGSSPAVADALMRPAKVPLRSIALAAAFLSFAGCTGTMDDNVAVFHHCAAADDVDSMERLVRRFPRIVDRPVTMFSGDCPLHTAAQTGRVRAAAFLVEHGADIHGRNARGRTPLHVACQEG